MMQKLANVPPKPPASQTVAEAAPHARAAAAVAVAALVLVVAAIAGLLWFRYGAAVFFDIVAAGIAACF